MKLATTTHAVKRYRERVKPALDYDACKEELLRLARGGAFTTEEPFPVSECPERSGFIELAPGIWTVCKDEPAQTRLLLTVLCHMGMSESVRQSRNRSKAKRREVRKRRGKGHIFKDGGRRNRLERWA